MIAARRSPQRQPKPPDSELGGVAAIKLYFETMAGTHLADSVRALRDAGSADALYDPSLRTTDSKGISYEDHSLARDEAQATRVAYSRRALLFAAFAAEAYANDFLYSEWGGKDREALQRMSTVDKYVFLPALAGTPSSLDRGKQPLQTIKWLFQRRDELVHAAPRGTDLTYDPTNHNPNEVAKCIVAVADAVAALNATVADGSVLSYVLAERQNILDYGTRTASELPQIHDPPVPADLLLEARRRHWNRGTGEDSGGLERQAE